MDFAPYQSSPPEHGRALSPTSQHSPSPRASLDAAARRGAYSPATGHHYQHRQSQFSPPPLQHPQPQRAWSGEGVGRYQSPEAGQERHNNGGIGGLGGGADYFGIGMIGSAREGMVSEFDTSLGLRLDYEACLAYLAVPPVGAILLLILERKSDYVRWVATGEGLSRDEGGADDASIAGSMRGSLPCSLRRCLWCIWCFRGRLSLAGCCF